MFDNPFEISKYPGSNIGGSNAWSGNHLGIFTSETRKRKKPEAPTRYVAPVRVIPKRGTTRVDPDVDTFDYGPG